MVRGSLLESPIGD
jgi:arylformamidase